MISQLNHMKVQLCYQVPTDGGLIAVSCGEPRGTRTCPSGERLGGGVSRSGNPPDGDCILLSAKHNGPVQAREMARRLGQRGGIARARRLSAERRRQIASLGGEARRRSIGAARRIADNFRYLTAVLAMQGGPPEVVRMKTFDGRLPGIYPDRS